MIVIKARAIVNPKIHFASTLPDFCSSKSLTSTPTIAFCLSKISLCLSHAFRSLIASGFTTDKTVFGFIASSIFPCQARLTSFAVFTACNTFSGISGILGSFALISARLSSKRREAPSASLRACSTILRVDSGTSIRRFLSSSSIYQESTFFFRSLTFFPSTCSIVICFSVNSLHLPNKNSNLSGSLANDRLP